MPSNAISPAAAVEVAPPIVHALGGATGSALALLLLYPLERVRIEMQTLAAKRNQDESSSSKRKVEKSENSTRSTQQQVNSTTDSLDKVEHGDPLLHENSSSSDGDDSDYFSPEEDDDESELSASWSMISDETLAEETRGLVSCILRLHQQRELYRGVTPVVSTLAASNFVFFYVHQALKRFISANPTPAMSLLVSSIAGIANVLLTNPLWVANMNIVTGKGTTSVFWKEIKQIYKSQGLKQLWSGTGASLLLVSNPVIQFFVYEQLKRGRIAARRRTKASAVGLLPLEAFCVGAVAKTIATILTYPLQLAQSILRISRNPTTIQEDTTKTYKGSLDCLLKLYKTGGLKSIYAGMRAKLVQTVLTAAFTFLTYEQILRVLHAAHLALMS